MKSLTIPGMINKSPASAPSRLLAAPPETVFLSLAGVFSMVNMLVPLRRIRALPARMSRMTSARTGNTPTKASKPDEGCKVGKQEGENEDWKVAAQAKLQ